MAKNKIRKKAQRQVAIRITEDPNVYGIPARAFMMEKLCQCGRGVMRPSGNKLVSPDGKGRTFIHGCSFEGCNKTEAHPMPWPRPDMVVDADATDPNIAAFMNRAREQRSAGEPTGGGITDG